MNVDFPLDVTPTTPIRRRSCAAPRRSALILSCHAGSMARRGARISRQFRRTSSSLSDPEGCIDGRVAVPLGSDATPRFPTHSASQMRERCSSLDASREATPILSRAVRVANRRTTSPADGEAEVGNSRLPSLL